MHSDFSSKISTIYLFYNWVPFKEWPIVRIAFNAHMFLKVSVEWNFSSLLRHKMQTISINLSLGWENLRFPVMMIRF